MLSEKITLLVRFEFLYCRKFHCCSWLCREKYFLQNSYFHCKIVTIKIYLELLTQSDCISFWYLFFLNGERLVKYDVLWCLWICVCTIDTLYLLIYVLSLILWCFRFTELLLHLTVKNICSSFNDKKIKMILPNEYQKASNPCWFKTI